MVASYNIHGCIGTDRKHDPSRIAQVIREINADGLGLQELHAHGVGPDPVDETQFLAAVSGFEVVPGTTFVGPRGAYGIALFALDRIWVHPPEALASVWAHNSPTARRASDHLPLVGMIKVVQPDAPPL